MANVSDYSSEGKLRSWTSGQTGNCAFDGLRTAVRIDPKDSGAQQVLGMALQQKGATSEAGEEFRKADLLNKERMSIQAATLATNSGAKQLREWDVDGAMEKFCFVLKLAPNFAPAHYQLGLALFRQGGRKSAQAEFVEAHQHLKPPRN